MHTTIQEIIPLLERIATALEANTKQPAAQGFIDYGKKVYCNITKGNGDGWYTLQHGGVAQTQKPMFRGEVVAINFPKLKRNNKEVSKFHLVMRANGNTITFESGSACFFSKSILSAFAVADTATLSKPIQLATYIQELDTGDKTLAVSIRDYNGNKLACDWTNELDWKVIAIAAVENVKAAVGDN